VLEALKDPREALRRAAQGGELARHLLDVEKTAREIAPFTTNFSEAPIGHWKCVARKQGPLSRLRKLLFKNYDAHYLRGNVLNSDSLHVDRYREHMPDYEAGYGRIIADVPKGSRVLDIGCGIGFLLFWLQKSRPDRFELVGVDISAPQINLAKRHLPGTVTLLHEDATDFLARNPEPFSAIFCTDVLEHVESDDEMLDFLELVKRSLLPSGYLSARSRICRIWLPAMCDTLT